MADLGELFAKLAAGDKLTPIDQMTLTQKGQQLESALTMVNNISESGTNDPYFNNFYAQQGEFGIIPLEMARLGTNTAQTISTGTGTILKPADAASASGRTFSHGLDYDVTEGSIRLGSFDSPAVFLVWAYLRFSGNSTGDRILSIFDADTGDPGSALVTLDKEPAPATVSSIMTATYIWRNAGGSGDNLRIGVNQDSGGDLNVDFWRFSAVRLH